MVQAVDQASARGSLNSPGVTGSKDLICEAPMSEEFSCRSYG